MAVSWSEDLSVGVAEIDQQHKELINCLSSLLQACNEGKGKEAVGEMVAFLDQYIVEHFSAEEKLQDDMAYPGRAEHKEHHAAFLHRFGELKRQFEQTGPTLPFVINLNRVVTSWLVDHIKKTDKALGQYIASKS